MFGLGVGRILILDSAWIYEQSIIMNIFDEFRVYVLFLVPLATYDYSFLSHFRVIYRNRPGSPGPLLNGFDVELNVYLVDVGVPVASQRIWLKSLDAMRIIGMLSWTNIRFSLLRSGLQ